MKKENRISLDTETTGVDLWHGARPFLVTICYEDGKQEWWEWDVNPFTRTPVPDENDLKEIRKIVGTESNGTIGLVLQNSKFDVTGLSSFIPEFKNDWPWSRTDDTLLMAHLLASNRPKDLTSLALMYLGIDIQPYEDRMKKACEEARRYCRANLPEWMIAKEGTPGMPSVKSSSKRAEDRPWKNDTWLPRTLRQHDYFKDRPEWDTVTSEYANVDSAITIALSKVMLDVINRRGLMEIYLQRRKLLEVIYDVEKVGVTVSRVRLEKLTREYTEASEKAANTCVLIASSRGHDLTLPKSGNNNSLLTFVFDNLKLPAVGYTETGNPSFDKDALDKYLAMYGETTNEHKFLTSLNGKRKADTAISYMSGYKRFWRAFSPGWARLHPNLNLTGTYTTRRSSSNPNEQNISRKEGFNLRFCFGPSPGREWWSFDGKNMELRFPAYEANEQEMIALFERPDDPPYFGSNHMLVSHVLFPKEFDACVRDGVSFKKRHPDLYDRVKRGNFAVQYGAQDMADGKGTADLNYGIPGAQAKIQARFSKQDALNKYWVRFAEKHGYVETIPDRTVNPKRGYPILSTRTEYGKIKPTVPFSNHIQGSVGWWMDKAEVRCHEFLKKEYPGFYMVMDVHDELVFDFPRGTGKEPWRTNLPIVREIKRLMEMGGSDLVMSAYPDGIPTPVSVEYHGVSYDNGLPMTDEMLAM